MSQGEVSRGDAEGNGRAPQTSPAMEESQGTVESHELDVVRDLPLRAKEYSSMMERLLERLQSVDEFVTRVCEMAQYYPRIEIEGRYYQVRTRRSNIGPDTALELADDIGAWRRLPSSVSQIGSGYWLHGDFHTHIKCAEREQILKMAKDVPKLLKEICARIQKELVEGLELLGHLEHIQDCIGGERRR